MTIENMISPEDADEMSSHYEALVGEAQESVVALEDTLAGLQEIEDQVSGDHGITKVQAASLESIVPGILPRHAPIASFTARPSVTNLKIALEEIDKKKAGIIAAIVLAVGAFVYKLWKWITGKSDDVATKVGGLETKTNAVVEAEEKYVEALEVAEAKGVEVHKLETEMKKAPELQDRTALIYQHYNGLVDSAMKTELIPNLSTCFATAVNAKTNIQTMAKAVNEIGAKVTSEFKAATADANNGDSEKVQKIHLTVEAVSIASIGSFAMTLHSVASIREMLAKNDRFTSKLPVVHMLNQNEPSASLPDAMESEKQWFNQYFSNIQHVEKENVEIHGNDGITKVLSSIARFKGRLAVLRKNGAEIKEFEGIAEEYTEDKIKSMIKTHESFSNDPQATAHELPLISDFVKFVAKYSQIIGVLIRIYLKVLSALDKFIESCKQYQATRDKTLREKVKSLIPGMSKVSDDPDEVVKAIFNTLDDHSK